MPHLSKTFEKRPELAREIGLLIADYAVLEIFLFEVYVALSLKSPQDAFSAFFSLRSINNKTDLVIAAAANLPPAYRRAVRRLVRRMKGAASRRTEIAHVHFMDVGKGPMRLHLVGETATVTPLTDEFLMRTADQFHTLGIDLIAFAAGLVAGNWARWSAIPTAATLSLDERLQSPPRPPGSPAPLSAAELAAADARLGLTEFLESRPIILRPRHPDLPNGYKLSSVVVRLP